MNLSSAPKKVKGGTFSIKVRFLVSSPELWHISIEHSVWKSRQDIHKKID